MYKIIIALAQLIIFYCKLNLITHVNVLQDSGIHTPFYLNSRNKSKTQICMPLSFELCITGGTNAHNEESSNK